jgi:hypothetical protein
LCFECSDDEHDTSMVKKWMNTSRMHLVNELMQMGEGDIVVLLGGHECYWKGLRLLRLILMPRNFLSLPCILTPRALYTSFLATMPRALPASAPGSATARICARLCHCPHLRPALPLPSARAPAMPLAAVQLSLESSDSLLHLEVSPSKP